MKPSKFNEDRQFMQQAIDLADAHMRALDGGPFGAIIARGDKIVGRGWNKVTSTNDPTAHAEMTAIRAAGAELKTFVLTGCVLYTSCEPCPMCLAAAYWARVDRIVYAATRENAAAIGFDDADIYTQIALPIASRRLPMEQLLQDKAAQVMEEWQRLPNKIAY